MRSHGLGGVQALIKREEGVMFVVISACRTWSVSRSFPTLFNGGCDLVICATTKIHSYIHNYLDLAPLSTHNRSPRSNAKGGPAPMRRILVCETVWLATPGARWTCDVISTACSSTSCLLANSCTTSHSSISLRVACLVARCFPSFCSAFF